ncbi:MAG: DNA (cytosine-5-)-methyltransferase [Metamycoplasmataceae bacterium]
MKSKPSNIYQKKNNIKEINLFEAFAGIGSQYKALKNISSSMNWDVKVVGIVEWFVDAIIAYEAIHGSTTPPPPLKGVGPQTDFSNWFINDINISLDSKKPLSIESKKKLYANKEIAYYLQQSKEVSKNLFDITRVSAKDLPKNIDIFTYSFPCQDLSGQGLGKGMHKKSNTRSGLLWEIDRILFEANESFSKDEMPKYLLLENVKAMINKNHYGEYRKWLDRLNKLGYESKQYILNSKDFGMAQARERVFVLSVLKSHKEKVNFEFSDPKTNKKMIPIKNILELEKNISFEDKFNQYALLEPSTKNKDIKKYVLQEYTNFSSENMVFDINYNGPTLTASGALSRIKLYYGKDKIRTMTPREAFKYMGFTNQDFNKVVKTGLVKPNKQIYLAGNSIVVNILEEIFRGLKF